MSAPVVEQTEPDGFTLTVELAGACRLCGHDAYGKDDLGPVHPCCVTWQGLMGEKWRGVCPACVESRRSRPRRNRKGSK